MTTESKVNNGSLTLGGTEFATQASNVRITPTYDEDGDALPMLDGGELTADVIRGNTLAITAVQDFTDAAGFVNYTWLNDLELVPFVWKPTGPTGPTYSGNVEVRAVEVGGDVKKRLTSDAEWTCSGPVNRTEAP
jgi:hypothetical protein